ncbi:hypothetical protein M011DRAFT_136085 [Sporormia fimetaria CBS 119925]|uniref:Uncharacterized protein n=1 Tax=Sporormia fimetaria CBS 119925 TaxID=1340428 RepID=A0A6A6V5T4_9PLEO|nr:hypothetical protein M011DRAFT_136085 [Sporormia fimetaria CBS 119925]
MIDPSTVVIPLLNFETIQDKHFVHYVPARTRNSAEAGVPQSPYCQSNGTACPNRLRMSVISPYPHESLISSSTLLRCPIHIFPASPNTAQTLGFCHHRLLSPLKLDLRHQAFNARFAPDSESYQLSEHLRPQSSRTRRWLLFAESSLILLFLCSALFILLRHFMRVRSTLFNPGLMYILPNMRLGAAYTRRHQVGGPTA